MTAYQLLNVIMISVVSLVAFETIFYWWRATKGTWKQWPAGRSMMYLLMIIAFGFGFGAINRVFGEYEARSVVSYLLYAAFIGGLIFIRRTIAAEMKRGERRQHKADMTTSTAPVTIIVATENREQSHGE